MARLLAAGLRFERATFHLGTLHPQVLGSTAVWNLQRGTCNELRVNVHIRETSDFLLSPLRPVIDERASVRLDPREPNTTARFPMMERLAEEGYTDYWAFPIPHGQSFHSAMTVATCSEGGLSPEATSALRKLLPALALNLDIVALGRIAQNVLAAYVGERSAKRVMEGAIRRGSGEMIDAIIWVSDMRNYTGLSDRLPGEEMIRLLNAYFERSVEAVQRNGGEVLKFIGDGMLAIFPVTDSASAQVAAKAALRAGRDALASISLLNGAQGDTLDIALDWRPLNLGIAFHRGPVFYGNIGARDRLDFTVTGPAVNIAARLEAMSKTTGRHLLFTDAVAQLLDEPADRLGTLSLSGVREKIAIFAAME
jgi:adenylate cyclase